jgi:hypothetical protein
MASGWTPVATPAASPATSHCRLSSANRQTAASRMARPSEYTMDRTTAPGKKAHRTTARSATAPSHRWRTRCQMATEAAAPNTKASPTPTTMGVSPVRWDSPRSRSGHTGKKAVAAPWAMGN